VGDISPSTQPLKVRGWVVTVESRTNFSNGRFRNDARIKEMGLRVASDM
jgi:hypothetical protein